MLGPLLGHPLDRGVGDLADRHRVGEQDGRLDQSPLLDLRDARDLAGAVEHEAAGDDAVLEDVGVGDHRGDAGAHGPLADVERAVADDEGGVADAHAGDVGDGVRFADREAADGKAELAEPLPHSGAGVGGSPPGATAGAGVRSPPFRRSLPRRRRSRSGSRSRCWRRRAPARRACSGLASGFGLGACLGLGLAPLLAQPLEAALQDLADQRAVLDPAAVAISRGRSSRASAPAAG